MMDKDFPVGRLATLMVCLMGPFVAFDIVIFQLAAAVTGNEGTASDRRDFETLVMNQLAFTAVGWLIWEYLEFRKRRKADMEASKVAAEGRPEETNS